MTLVVKYKNMFIDTSNLRAGMIAPIIDEDNKDNTKYRVYMYFKNIEQPFYIEFDDIETAERFERLITSEMSCIDFI